MSKDDAENKQLPTANKSGAIAPAQDLRAGQLIEHALANLTPEQRQELIGKAGDEALEIEVRKRNMALESEQSRHDIQAHIDVTRSLDQSGNLNRQTVKSEVKTGSGRMTIESKSGAQCFVATVAFRDASHPDVQYLRWFRDTHLSGRPLGDRFITWYWRVGPKMATWATTRPLVLSWIRAILSALVSVLRRLA